MVKKLKIIRYLESFKMVARPNGANIFAYPDGDLKKFRAQFCVCVDQKIDGLDMFDTFAPVVA